MSTNDFHIFHSTPMLTGESPVWHAEEKCLYWVDIPGCVVHRKHIDTLEHFSWKLPSEPGCIALHEKGGLIVAMRTEIAHLNTEDGQLATLAPVPYDPQTTRFNDGRCDAKGRFWIGTMYEPRDQALGSLYCFEQGKLRKSGSPVTVSNGLAFSPDNRILFHADTTAHAIYRYEFDADTGSFRNREVFRQFSKDKTTHYGGRPDGAAVDSEGAYWIAMYEGARILRLSPFGEILREIALPLRCPTMLAFGGSGLRTLFITSASQNRSQAELDQFPASGCVLSMQVEIAGMPPNLYRT
jgi:sugar lactone lactonase YvrE